MVRNLTDVVSIRVLVGIAQEPIRAGIAVALGFVSIRVLVGIAQEPFWPLGPSRCSSSFNPCVGRNSSGALEQARVLVAGLRFQSVCWSE